MIAALEFFCPETGEKDSSPASFLCHDAFPKDIIQRLQREDTFSDIFVIGRNQLSVFFFVILKVLLEEDYTAALIEAVIADGRIVGDQQLGDGEHLRDWLCPDAGRQRRILKMALCLVCVK